MKTPIRLALGLIAVTGMFQYLSAQTILFSDDFESGLGNWVNNSPGLAWSTDQNHTPSGSYSAKNQTSTSRMYHNFGAELDGYFKLTFWFYDDAGTRSYGQAVSYTGTGFLDGGLQQLFAIGKYHVGFGTSSGIFASEVVNTSLYQGRIVAGPDRGWFNLPGIARTPGAWVKFDFERLANGTVNFFVNDTLSRSVTTATYYTIDSISLGSVVAGTTVTVNYFDDVTVTVPEPSAVVLSVLGGLGLLLAVFRRRNS